MTLKYFPFVDRSGSSSEFNRLPVSLNLCVLETIGTIGTSVTVGTGFVFATLMELLHRYSGLKQRIIAERDDRFGKPRSESDPGKIETEPKLRKWFQDLTWLSTQVKI
jgi:hypothetical protein